MRSTKAGWRGAKWAGISMDRARTFRRRHPVGDLQPRRSASARTERYPQAFRFHLVGVGRRLYRRFAAMVVDPGTKRRWAWNFPYGPGSVGADQTPPFATKQQRSRLSFLRSHGKYLIPGQGINIWSALAVVLRTVLLSVVVWIPLLTLLTFLILLVDFHVVDKAINATSGRPETHPAISSPFAAFSPGWTSTSWTSTSRRSPRRNSRRPRLRLQRTWDLPAPIRRLPHRGSRR